MLQSLPKWARGEVELANLMAAVPTLASRLYGFIAPAQEFLTQVAKVPCVIAPKRMSIEKTPEVTGTLFAATWPPSAGLFWVEIDRALMQMLVYQAIGQPVPQKPDPKLSNLERGVALYVLARLFENTKDSFQLSDQADLPTAPSACLSLSFTLGETNSYIRIWVSKDLIVSLGSTNPISAEQLEKNIQDRTAWAETPLCIQLASMNLSNEDVKNLEVGDVILLENTHLALQEKILVGEAAALLGIPADARLKGQLGVSQAGPYSFSISEISFAKEPS